MTRLPRRYRNPRRIRTGDGTPLTAGKLGAVDRGGGGGTPLIAGKLGAVDRGLPLQGTTVGVRQMLLLQEGRSYLQRTFGSHCENGSDLDFIVKVDVKRKRAVIKRDKC